MISISVFNKQQWRIIIILWWNLGKITPAGSKEAKYHNYIIRIFQSINVIPRTYYVMICHSHMYGRVLLHTGPGYRTRPHWYYLCGIISKIEHQIFWSGGRLHQADDREIIKGQWKSSLGKISNAAYDFGVDFTVNPNFTNIYKQLRIIS